MKADLERELRWAVAKTYLLNVILTVQVLLLLAELIILYLLIFGR